MEETKIAERFIDEKLAPHWQVDRTRESLERLLYHLKVRSNFWPYFEEAVRSLDLGSDRFISGLTLADIGSGVSWTSAILAKHPKVKLVYAVDPSENRLNHARFVMGHFNVSDKVKLTRGTFLEPNIPEKIDIAVLCGSIHHCYDDQIPSLFSNIKKLLKPGGLVLVANEHYVDWRWTLKMVLSYMKHLRDKGRYYSLKTLRSPHPFDGEHWRTRKELENIFETSGFSARFFLHQGDLCKDKPTSYHRMGWHYYYAVLELK